MYPPVTILWSGTGTGWPPGSRGPWTVPSEESPDLLTGNGDVAPARTWGAAFSAWQITQLTPSARIRSCALVAPGFTVSPMLSPNGSVSLPVMAVPMGP